MAGSVAWGATTYSCDGRRHSAARARHGEVAKPASPSRTSHDGDDRMTLSWTGSNPRASLRARHLGAGAYEDRNLTQRYVYRDGAAALELLRAVPVAPPLPLRQVHVATSLADEPHRRDQQVGTEEVLVPQVFELLVLAVGKWHRAHDR